jgi:hypothetical protein
MEDIRYEYETKVQLSEAKKQRTAERIDIERKTWSDDHEANGVREAENGKGHDVGLHFLAILVLPSLGVGCWVAGRLEEAEEGG